MATPIDTSAPAAPPVHLMLRDSEVGSNTAHWWLKWVCAWGVRDSKSVLLVLVPACQATRIAVGMSMETARVIAPASEGAEFSSDGRFLAVTLAEEVRILETTGYGLACVLRAKILCLSV